MNCMEQAIEDLHFGGGSCRRRHVPEGVKIVCLCGSTRFWERFRDEGLKLTLEGKIVLSIGICAPDSMVLAHPDTTEGKAQKARLDELHLSKIDLADEVFVLNVGGYTGESTRREIEYARAHGKRVVFLEPEGEPPARAPEGVEGG